MFRCRVDRALLSKANRVAEEVGTTPGEVVRHLFKQMAKRGAIPFPLAAETPDDEILTSARRRAGLWDEMNEGRPATR